MPSVEELKVQYSSDIAAKAGADAAALDKLADSTDAVDQKITRAGSSVEALSNKLIGNEAAAARIATANRRYQDDLAAIARAEALAGGATDQTTMLRARAAAQLALNTQKATDYGAALDQKLTSAIASSGAAMGASTVAAAKMAAGHDIAHTAADGAGLATAGFTRELIVLGHEGLVGNYNRIPGSLLVLAERSGNLHGIISGLGAIFTSAFGQFAIGATVGIGAMVAIGVKAEELLQEQNKLAIAIQSVGRSAELSAGQLQQYSRSLGQQGVTDPQAVVSELARTPTISSSAIGQLVGLLPDASAAIGSQEKAFQLLKDAATGSSEGVQKLVDAFNLLTPQEDANVRTMLEHHDKAAALDEVFAALHNRIVGLNEKSLGPMQQAFRDLGNAWSDFINRIAGSEPVLRMVEGLSNTLRSNNISDLTGKLAQLQGQQMDLQRQVTANPPPSSFFGGGGQNPGALRAQLLDNQRQQAALQAQIDALTKPLQTNAGTTSLLAGGGSIGAGTGANDNLQAQRDIERAAQSVVAGSPSGQITKLTQQIKDFQAERDKLDRGTASGAALWNEYTKAIGVDQKAIDDINKKNEEHLTGLEKVKAELNSHIAAQGQLADAYGKGVAAVNLVLAQQEAEKQALEQHLIPGTAKYAAAVADLTRRHLEDNQATGLANISKQLSDTNRQTDAQLSINAAYDGTVASVTHAQNVQKAYGDLIAQHLTPDTAEFTSKLSDLTAAYDRGSDASLQFQQAQQSVQALTGALSNAFDQLGQGIVNAFLSGSGQAVNFGNIVRSVLGSIATELVKLAVINPIVNSLGFSNALPTLGSAINVLSNGGTASGSSTSGGSSLLSTGGNLLQGVGLLDKLGLTNIGGQFSGLGQSLGLTGSGGLFSGVNSILDTQLIGGLSAGQFGPVTSGLAAGGAGLPAGLTVGSFLGGAGAGFGLGSLAGGFVQSSLGKTGPAPTIGAGVGAAAGAAIGSIIPGIGTLIGGIIGGLIGGAGGGLIGPKPPSPFSSTGISLDNGHLVVGNTVSQLVNASGERTDTVNVAAALNTILDQNGIILTSLGGASQIGQNSPKGFQDPSKFSTANAAFGGFQFSASDPVLNANLSGKSFASLDDFAAEVQKINVFVHQTVPSLESFSANTGTLQQQVDAINGQFAGAIATAHELNYAEADLTAVRDKAVQAARDAAANSAQDQTNQYAIRAAISGAQLSGSPADALSASLWQFDRNAWAEKTQLDATLVATFGDSYRTTAQYADEMANLEKALGNERLLIQKQYNDQLTSSATSVVTSISSYIQKFQTGASSPLGPLAQLSLATDQFNAVSGAAQAGDFNSISQFTGYADTYANAARAVYGSGTGYVQAVDRILAVAGQIAGQGSDVLTASVQRAEIRTQTQVLGDKLDALTAQVAALRADTQQIANKPAALAA